MTIIQARFVHDRLLWFVWHIFGPAKQVEYIMGVDTRLGDRGEFICDHLIKPYSLWAGYTLRRLMYGKDI